MLVDFGSDLFIGLFEAFDGGVEAANVLVDEQVLLLLLQEGLGDLLQVLDPALFLDFLKVMVYQVHVSLVLVDDLDLVLVLGDQVSKSQLEDGLRVDALCFCVLVLVLLPVVFLTSFVEAMLDHVDFMFVLFELSLVGFLDPNDGLFHSLDGGLLEFDFSLFIFDFFGNLLDIVGKELKFFILVFFFLPDLINLEFELIVFGE